MVCTYCKEDKKFIAYTARDNKVVICENCFQLDSLNDSIYSMPHIDKILVTPVLRAFHNTDYQADTFIALVVNTDTPKWGLSKEIWVI